MNLRRLACKWLRATPNEDADTTSPASSWADLWDHRESTVVWPRVTASDTWKLELEPWLKKSLLTTMVQLVNEPDEARALMLRERAKLLNEWLETPRIAQMKAQAALNNAFGSGDPERIEVLMERARPHARR